MRAILVLLLCLFSGPVFAQEKSDTQELLGHMGGRAALLRVYSTVREDGSARVTGDYILLATMQQRFLEGDRSKQLGVTVLREGNSAILYGRPALATLQGTWSGGVFKGQRFGPEGQERERFEFSEEFPPMDAYDASVSCEAGDARYASNLAYVAEAGKLKSIEWTSHVKPDGHGCVLPALQQQAMRGGIKAASGACAVTLREVGELVKVTAENCSAACGSGAYFEPVLVDRRGGCTLLRPVDR